MPSEYEHKNEIEHRRHNKESILLNFFRIRKTIKKLVFASGFVFH